MSKTLNLKRGLTLNIVGKIDGSKVDSAKVSSIAVTPDDFTGIVPKVCVREGDAVKAGQAVIFDKAHPELKLVSPVDGTVKAVVRGERRKLLRVEITASPTQTTGTKPVTTSDPAAIKAAMLDSGVWAMMRQRPYDIVPAPDSEPRDIFVTLFDLAPLAPDTDWMLADQIPALTQAVKALARLTSGKVYVCRRDGSELPDIEGAENYVVKGAYPASNAGVQIANIAPVNKGETVWTLNARTALMLGHLMQGAPLYDTVVALTGPGVSTPGYVTAPMGASIAELLAGNINDNGHHLRYISGNVFTGVNVGADGYLRWPYTQVTVIDEGDDVDEFMGWASVRPGKLSTSRSFPGHFMSGREFNPDARLLGGRRAMIMSGQYDKVMPMDIMPEYLIKAILSRDIDRMEALGIYEVAPEDFAAAEFVDTSKLPLQQIVRDGLDYMHNELG